MNNLMTHLGYFTGGVFILFGIAFIFTNILPINLPTQFKIITGIVFILYGIYRILITAYKKRKADEDNF